MPEPSERPPIASAPLSVLLLADNNGIDLEEVVTAWANYLNGLGRIHEILLVDDGSSDNTGVQADSLASRFAQVRVLRHAVRAGPGAALRTGLAAAQYPLLFYTTCDKQYQPADLQRLLDDIDKVDLVTGYRVGRPVPGWLVWWDRASRLFVRVLFGIKLEARDCWLGWRGYWRRWLGRWVFGVRVRDPECAFRLARREIFAGIPIQSTNLAHIELLAKANFLGCWLAEAPVTCLPGTARKGPVESPVGQEARQLFQQPDFGPVILAPVATATVIQSSGETSVFGRPAIFTAIVYPVPENLAGAVRYLVDGVEQLKEVPFKGQASFTTTVLEAGLHTIRAIYEGNARYAASASASLSHFVKPAPAALVLKPPEVESVYGSEVTFTAAVTSAEPAPKLPSGVVAFKDGAVMLGAATLIEGVAAFATKTLDTGFHAISAVYEGDANFAASPTASLSHFVKPVPTAISLRASQDESIAGREIIFTATVHARGPMTTIPSGTIALTDGDTTLQETALRDGAASFAVVNLAVGVHNLTAVYLGDHLCADSVSEVVSCTIHSSQEFKPP